MVRNWVRPSRALPARRRRGRPRRAAGRSDAAAAPRPRARTGRAGAAGRSGTIVLMRPGPGGEHHDAVGERHRLVDMVGDEQHGGAAVAPDIEQEVLHLLARVCTSSAAKGSSISSTFGRMASARATATRWRMPPDSSSGPLVDRLGQADALQRLPRRSLWRSDSGTPGMRQAEADVLPDASAKGKSEVSWKIRLRSGEGPARPARRRTGVRRPWRARARRSGRAACSCRSRMGRGSTTNSPGATSRSMSRSASWARGGAGRPDLADAAAGRRRRSATRPGDRHGLRGHATPPSSAAPSRASAAGPAAAASRRGSRAGRSARW